LGTDGEKNIDWIDTDNRLTVKKHRLDRWSLEEKKILGRWFNSIEKIIFFEPMTDTIGQKKKIFNRWIDTIGSQHDR
jgi:hypothetical protein